MDPVARGTWINLVTRTAAVGAVLLITTITARLGTEVQGAFAIFTSVEGVLLALFSGFGIALARRVSHHGDEPRALLAASLLACFALGALAGLGLWLLSRHGGPAYASLWLLALAAPWLLIAPNASGLWLGAGRMMPMARLTLAPPLLTLALIAALALLAAPTTLAPSAAPTTLMHVLGGWVGAKVLVAAAVLWVLWRGARLAAPSWALLRAELPFIATIGVTNLIGLMNYRVGLFVVERQLGLGAAGVYSIAVVVAELLWFVSSSLTQAAYGRLGHPDRERAAATTVRVVQLGVAALLLAAPVLWAGAALLLPWLLGPDYAASVVLIGWLLPGVLLFGGASALSAYFTNHAGQPQVPARVAALSLVLNACLSWLLVPLLGMAGAALAASASYAATVLVLAALFARHAGLPLAALLVPGPQLRRDLQAVASWPFGR
jgi:O-antigen/teichoic acid export membrane protein